ncbi:outer membrane beta-barrel protein [bacterium]|nr:outer membrane beta-barrel protein [bacterium]
MKKVFQRFSLIIILIGLGQQSYAQRWFSSSSLEFGIIVGASHYAGDLTQQYLETRGLKPSVGLITRYNATPALTFRLSGQWGGLEGDDTWYDTEEGENPRNLYFKSVLWDFTGALEINLNQLDQRQESGVIPYVFVGASVFKYNPMAQFIYDPSSPHLSRPGSAYANLQDRDGDWVELQPLSTEGQETTEFNERKRYNLTQVAIPLGLGFKFKLNSKWTLGIEYGARITFTDYLDDVSSSYVEPVRLESAYGPMSAAMADRSPTLHEEGAIRGEEANNDKYGILGLTFTYRIIRSPGCPTF